MRAPTRPGLTLSSSRLREIRDAIAPWAHSVSFRQAGRPFLPQSKGYNRWDDPYLHAELPELSQMSGFVMRHRRGGGRVELLADGGVMCKRCFHVFATLVEGNQDWSLISACLEEEAERDSRELHAARRSARVNETLKSLEDWMKQNGAAPAAE